MDERLIKLSPRLSACADFVPEGTTLADIGTDHAYLPVFLIQQGRVRTPVFACDINSGPLKRAGISAVQYGVEDKISFFLTDGLKGLEKNCADTIVIAGMGGETIAGIITASGWEWNENSTLILQPMSKQPELCRFLYANGFYIEGERLVRDAGEIYRVLKVKKGEREQPTELELNIGKNNGDKELINEYVSAFILKLTRAKRGLESSVRADKQQLSEISELLLAAEKYREELMKNENC